MPTYDFVCEDCPVATAQIKKEKRAGLIPKGEKTIPVCHHEPMFSMSQAPAVGDVIACPVQGCGGRLVRVPSIPEFLIKTPEAQAWGTASNTVRTRVGDKEIDFQFVDHPHTKPGFQNQLTQLANQSGISSKSGMGQAYYSQEHGRYVVEVKSNVPDPLGAIERGKSAGQYDYTKIKVDQPFKVRKPKKK